MEIGAKGLQRANLIIPQGTTLAFTIVHKDESGNIVDHSADTFAMAFQTRDNADNIDASQYVTATARSIEVTLPDAFTSTLAIGTMLWDLIVTAGSGSTRLVFGDAIIVDTYALDGE